MVALWVQLLQWIECKLTTYDDDLVVRRLCVWCCISCLNNLDCDMLCVVPLPNYQSSVFFENFGCMSSLGGVLGECVVLMALVSSGMQNSGAYSFLCVFQCGKLSYVTYTRRYN